MTMNQHYSHKNNTFTHVAPAAENVSWRRCRLRFLLLMSSIVCSSLPADARADQEWFPKSLQVHGFLSQALISTSENNFFGKSEDRVSTDFREIGINASWQPIPSFQASLQLVLRDAGKTDDGDIRVDYGLADYALISTETDLWGIRGGRVPTPLGLYNDTRDVDRGELSERAVIVKFTNLFSF